MFWCDAEERMKGREERIVETGWWDAKWKVNANGERKGRFVDGLSFVERGEEGRLGDWASVVKSIPSSWLPIN